MNRRVILYNSGRILCTASALWLLPFLVSLILRDGCALSFLIPAVLMLLLGFLLSRKKPQNMTSYAREGFVTVSALWLIFSVFGALPFFLSGEIPSFTDAFFEAVSGFTTTGSTILVDIEALAPSMLFWRSFSHWVGGMGVLALAIAVMPGKGKTEEGDNAAMHLLRAETPGPTFGKLVAKLRYNVRILYAIYTVMTVMEIFFLLAGDMPLFDSILTAFGTAGTGGFAIKNSSIAYYDSAYLEMVIAVFMLLFGINFNVYYFLLTGKIMKVLRSEELRWYLCIVLCASGAIALNILPMYQSAAEALRDSFFQVSSIITTTGFITANYDLWPVFSQLILVLLMFCGACASSTAGGLKISRVIILVKTAFRELRAQVHPREVRVIRCDDEPISAEVVHGVSVYFCIYSLILAASALLLALDGKDIVTTVTAAITCLNNVGPGLNEVGAIGNFSGFSNLAKWILSFDMLAGRLELYPLLILFSPSVWRRMA